MKPLHHKTHPLAKRGLSLLCALALCLSLLPATALAAEEIKLFIGGQQITESGCYENQNGTWTKVEGTEPASGQFSYDADSVTLTLNQAEIVNYQDVTVGGGFTYPGSVIAFSQSADVSLKIVVSQGTSTITGTGGIRVMSKAGDASLSISGPGSLEVNVDRNDSGISLIGSKNVNLNIDGADVKTLAAYYYGVDLHAGDGFTAAAVVNNGKLTAGGSGSIGIYYRWTNPSNSCTSCLTVSGNAMVDTEGSTGGIINGSPDSFQIGADGESGGIVFNGKSGTVYGDVTLQEDLEIGTDETLTIGKDASLTVPDGKTLTNNGTVTTEEGGTLTGNVTGTVIYKVTDVSLNKTSLTLTDGGSETLTAIITPSNATNKNVTWSSEDTDVISVAVDQTDNTKATVKALKEGSATITATTADGNKTATCTVTVTAKTYSLSVDPATLNFGSINEGDAQPAAQTVTITNTGNQTVMLEQPTAENFEIGTLSKTTLEPDETASLTIQPKDKLPRGSYSEQIVVSNTNGEKAAITATFTVKEPPYTGKYSYELSTSVGDHGSLTVDRYATEGDKVTISVSPDEAYKLDDLSVTAGGKEVALTAGGDGTYTFTMPSADVKITATFAKDPDWTEPEEPATDVSDLFLDVTPNAWYKDAVQYAYDSGLMTGVSANEFAPEQTTTRAMIVSMLARLEGVESANNAGFADVSNEWYATAVNWAASAGVVNGYEDSTFRPNTAITREQLAAILMNYASYKGEDVSNRADLTSYTDQPSTWAEEAISWSVAEGLLTGVTADTLQPQGAATRAQVAAILQRFLSE